MWVCYRMPSPPILRLTLRDGRPVALRPIEPSDRERLRDGFEALSPTSRQSRFHGALSSLTDSALDYLTSIDGQDHVAWGALDLSHPDAPGFGVGRFVRLEEEPTVAEFSLTVLDSVQGHGVGLLLLAVLVVEADRVGVDVLRGVVGQDNDRMVRWLRRLGASSEAEDVELVMDLALPIDPERSTTAADFVETIERVRTARETGS